jgi:eukaryotic-like serine/threonine-protein kinase
MAADISTNTAPDAGAVLAQRYRVLRRIGEGGMGVVVEAENTVTGKRVAIKWMHPQVATTPGAVERFMREARASARVRHPNVVDVYDVVQEPSGVFMVMELLEGESLAMLIDRGGVPAHAVIALLIEAMRGVSAAHRQGVIHRDIKPDNIFLAKEADRATAVPKVLDFGISKLTGANEAINLTATGAAIGTPLYMSYEQLCGAKDIDARADVYAFGVILYEALAGVPPYQAETFPELIVKIASQTPAPLKQVRPDIPAALEEIVARAMAKERSVRPASLEVLIESLEPYANAQSFSALMTAERAATSRVTGRDLPAADPLIVEGRPSQVVGTPLQAELPIPRPPRERSALPWILAAVAAGGGLIALTMSRSGSEGAQPGAIEPAAAGLPPSAAADPMAAPKVEAEVPKRDDVAARPARPASAAALQPGAAARPTTSANAHPGAAALQPGAAARPASSASAQPAAARPAAIAPAAPANPPHSVAANPARPSVAQPPAHPIAPPPAAAAARNPAVAPHPRPSDIITPAWQPAPAAKAAPTVQPPPVKPEPAAQPQPRPKEPGAGKSSDFRAGKPRAEDF